MFWLKLPSLGQPKSQGKIKAPKYPIKYPIPTNKNPALDNLVFEKLDWRISVINNTLKAVGKNPK